MCSRSGPSQPAVIRTLSVPASVIRTLSALASTLASNEAGAAAKSAPTTNADARSAAARRRADPLCPAGIGVLFIAMGTSMRTGGFTAA
jgi:hypothetical protein